MTNLFFPDELAPARSRSRRLEVERGIFDFKFKPIDFFTDDTLVQEVGNVLAADTEIYPNFFFFAAKSEKTGRVCSFELSPAYPVLDTYRLNWVMTNFCIVTFNGNHFDIPLIFLALAGYGTQAIYEAAQRIIEEDNAHWRVARDHDVVIPQINHIDLKNLFPKDTSLKAGAASLGTETIQDLPYPPGTVLTAEQANFTRHYCVNDLNMTLDAYRELKPQIVLRENQGAKYGIDLRSRSDAQMAESIFVSRLTLIKGGAIDRPKIPEGTEYKYDVPDYLEYDTPELKAMLEEVRETTFVVNEKGRINLPPTLEGRIVNVHGVPFKMGVGGLHSTESCAAHFGHLGDTAIDDDDVTGYYPRIITTQRLYPPHLGEVFLDEFTVILVTREQAKEMLAKGELDPAQVIYVQADADGLKIVVNGTFGKLSSKYSVFYAPKLLMQVTLSGQLLLLKQIEMQMNSGIEVISANTDGVVTKFPEHLRDVKTANIKAWEQMTGLSTENTKYAGLFSRDVNSYIAVKKDFSGVKLKGAYANPWSDKKATAVDKLKKKPSAIISTEAAVQYILKGTPIEDTIRACQDVRKFVSVMTVRGGAAHNGRYLGKVVRWYYKKDERGHIQKIMNGGQVPGSVGAWPIMDISGGMPADLDYEWYITKAVDRLKDVGFLKSAGRQASFEFDDVAEDAEEMAIM